MGSETKIQWTDHTFNPWVGCARVSPGCVNCYAEAYDKRVGGVPVSQRDNPDAAELRWGAGAPRTRTTVTYWRQPLKWNAAAEKAGVRARVFCASLADVFEDRPDLEPWRRDLFALIDATPWLDWQLLTKRPENIARLMPPLPWPESACGKSPEGDLVRRNVWLGCTVEDQRRANERIPELIRVPAMVRFLSCEPLLERVDLSRWLDEDQNGFHCEIDWVIVGGESGPGARPFDVAWAREIVNECRDAGRGDPKPFVKQFGSRPIDSGRVDHFALRLADHHGGDMSEWPEDLRVREFPEVR
jgi:protein gp37